MALVLLSVKMGCKWLEHTLCHLFLLWHCLFFFAVVFPPQISERRLQFLVRAGGRKLSVVHHLLSHLKSSISFLKTRGWFDESGKWLSVKLDTESHKILGFDHKVVWVIEDTDEWERGIAKFLVLSFRCWQNFQIRLMDMGRGGEGEMYGKSNMETYITICKIDSNENLLYGSGNSNRGSVST